MTVVWSLATPKELIPVSDRLFLAACYDSRLVACHAQGVDPSVLLAMHGEAAFRPEVPSEEAPVPARGDCVLVIGEEVEIGHPGLVLLEVGNMLLCLQLPNPEVALAPRRDHEPHVCCELHAAYYALVHVV